MAVSYRYEGMPFECDERLRSQSLPEFNQRRDGYGETRVDRARFIVQVVAAVATAVSAGKVGLRISPEHNISDFYWFVSPQTAARGAR